ncbi:MAG: pyridoxal-phosphate-dependent aminotransferase family protein [Opitutales bacterium]
MSYKLFIPGPIEVAPHIYKAMSQPMIGHRSPDFVALFKDVQPKLQQAFFTTDPVYISTSSAWGVMEGILRSLVKDKKVLNCCSGAFSDKWHDVTQRMGIPCEALKFEWGQPVDPEALRAALSTGEFDIVTLIHNETSTGTMSPIAEIAAVLKDFPEVYSIVDCVSSFSVLPIAKDTLGIDVLLTGSQKALALPPGMALFTVSERAHERAESVDGRGYYFDLIEFRKNYEKGMTPSTPCIPLIYGLQAKLNEIFAEGLEARYARHARTNQQVHDWVKKHDFELLPDLAYASKSLTCVRNNREMDIPALNAALKERFSCVIDGGYGKIKGKTFRISNMGDETEATISGLLNNLDTLLAEMPELFPQTAAR